MAKAKVTCTCQKCEKEFNAERICRNRRSADEWESWAADNYVLCPACYAEQKAEADAKKVKDAGIVFPVLEAVSEKQLNYAEKVRLQFALDELDELVDVAEVLSCSKEELVARCDGDYEKVWEAFQSNCKKHIAVLRETDAGKLLDIMLKRER